MLGSLNLGDITRQYCRESIVSWGSFLTSASGFGLLGHKLYNQSLSVGSSGFVRYVAFNNSASFFPSGRPRYEAFNNSSFISSSVRVSSGHGTSIRYSDISLISSFTLARVVGGIVQLYIISVRSSTTLSSLSSKSSKGYNGGAEASCLSIFF